MDWSFKVDEFTHEALLLLLDKFTLDVKNHRMNNILLHVTNECFVCVCVCLC